MGESNGELRARARVGPGAVAFATTAPPGASAEGGLGEYNEGRGGGGEGRGGGEGISIPVFSQFRRLHLAAGGSRNVCFVDPRRGSRPSSESLVTQTLQKLDCLDGTYKKGGIRKNAFLDTCCTGGGIFFRGKVQPLSHLLEFDGFPKGNSGLCP